MTESARTGRLLTLDEAADYVRLKPKTLRNKLYAGTGPRSYHVGAGRQFRVADLDAWINKHAVPAKRPRPPPGPVAGDDYRPASTVSAPPATAGPLISLEDAAAYIKMKPQSLRNMLSARRDPPRSYLVGNRRRFRVADLDAWISRRASDAPPLGRGHPRT